MSEVKVEYRVESRQYYDNFVDYKKITEVMEDLKKYYNFANRWLKFISYYVGTMKDEEKSKTLTEEHHEQFRLFNSYIDDYNILMREPKGKDPIPHLTLEKWIPHKIAFRWILDNRLHNDKGVDGISNPRVEVFNLLLQNWGSFFALLRKGYSTARKPSYLGEWDSIPIVYKFPKIKDGKIRLPKALGGVEIPVDPDKDYKIIEIVRKNDLYSFNLVYTVELEHTDRFEGKENERIVGIDLGVNRFATMVNNFGEEPLAISGEWLKSRNYYYNMKRKELQPLVNFRKEDKTEEDLENIQKYRRLSRYYYNKQKDYFHKASKAILNYCLYHSVDTVVIGRPELHNFVEKGYISIAFSEFVDKLTYKLREYGIRLLVVDEYFTTVVSAFDNESLSVNEDGDLVDELMCEIVDHSIITLTGKEIDIDVNAGYNIIRKAFPEFKVKSEFKHELRVVGLDKELPDYLKTEYIQKNVLIERVKA